MPARVAIETRVVEHHLNLIARLRRRNAQAALHNRQNLAVRRGQRLPYPSNTVFGKSRNAGLAVFWLPPFHEARARACSDSLARSNPSISNAIPASRAASTMKSSGKPKVSYKWKRRWRHAGTVIARVLAEANATASGYFVLDSRHIDHRPGSVHGDS